MHLAEIIQNVIDPESPGEYVMEPAPTPTPTSTRHKSTVVASSPEPTPRKKRKTTPKGRKGTHECPIDIDSSDDGDDDDDDDEMVRVPKERDNSDDIKPMLRVDSAQMSREGSIAGKGAGREEYVTLVRKKMTVPATIIDARTSSGSNPIRNHTPTSLSQRSVEDAVRSANSPIRTTHSVSESTSHPTNLKSPNPKVIESDTPNISTSTIPTSSPLPSTNSIKSASSSSTRPITPLSHAMLSSIHGKPNPIPRPIRNLTPVVNVPHRSSPHSPPRSQSDPKPTGIGADKDDIETREKAQKSTSRLLGEDTAAYGKPPDESRCQPPTGISALRRQTQAATVSMNNDRMILSTAATVESTLLASSSISNPTPHPAHEPLGPSGISTNSKSRNLPPAGGSSSSNPTETMTSIIPTHAPSHTAKDPSPASDMVDKHLRDAHSTAVLRSRLLGSRPSAGPISHSVPQSADDRTAGRTDDSTTDHDEMRSPKLPMNQAVPPRPPVSVTRPLNSAGQLLPERDERAVALKEELMAKKLHFQKRKDSGTTSPAAASTGLSMRGAAPTARSTRQASTGPVPTTKVEDTRESGPVSQSVSTSQETAAAEVNCESHCTLVGAEGEILALVQPHVTAATLCKYYAKKKGLRADIAVTLRLSLNGRIVNPSTKVKDMSVVDEGKVGCPCYAAKLKKANR